MMSSQSASVSDAEAWSDPLVVEPQGRSGPAVATPATETTDHYNGLPEYFGPYELTRLLGSGGMAEVYEARKTGRHGVTTKVALKRMHPRACQERSHVQMFIREAALLSRLQHPGLLQIHEFNEVKGQYFIAMEHVDGCDLGELLTFMRHTHQLVPTSVVMDVMVQVLEALAYAHGLRDDHGRRLDLIHRDIKPSNILLSRTGQVKLGDFGLAKVQGALYQTMTNTHVKGTLRYMSPEHVQLKPITQQSDLYSLGVVLYEMLTLEPFIAPDANLSTIVRVITLQPIEQTLAAVPEEFELLKSVLYYMLQREQISRFGSADEILDDLHAMRHLIPAGPDLRHFMATRWREVEQFRKRLARQ